MALTQKNSTRQSKIRGDTLDVLPEVDAELQREADLYRHILRTGELVRQLRQERGWTQAELARRAGTTQAEISDLERGVGSQGPTVRTLSKLFSELGEEFLITSQRELDQAIDENLMSIQKEKAHLEKELASTRADLKTTRSRVKEMEKHFTPSKAESRSEYGYKPVLNIKTEYFNILRNLESSHREFRSTKLRFNIHDPIIRNIRKDTSFRSHRSAFHRSPRILSQTLELAFRYFYNLLTEIDDNHVVSVGGFGQLEKTYVEEGKTGDRKTVFILSLEEKSQANTLRQTAEG
jgi:transcriptional regulator with XRE-family HTH domain